MEIIKKSAKETSSTLLCVGPLSTNIIDVTIDFARHTTRPIIFVASRRQVDSAELGGGYVNNWCSLDLVNYIKSKKEHNILIERDHGGPHQGQFEINNKLSTDESMKVAKKSFEADIDAGFDILHIDPTIPIANEDLTYSKVLARLFELYGHVQDYANSRKKNIKIEIGTEEQNGSYTDFKQLEDFLEETAIFCKKNKFENPAYVVIQTGAKVMENRNIGLFERGTKFDRTHLIKNIQEASRIAAKHQIEIKEHNGDYLSFENLCLRPNIGISASNIAPEFAVIESKALFYYLNQFGQFSDYEELISFVVGNNKWQKWVLPDSKLSNYEKACLSAHYCYSQPQFIEIKNKLNLEMKNKGLELDSLLKQAIANSIHKYLIAFGLLKI